ncbi:hypothetical protein QCA50_014923 [Cerrena zonata]|uniref:XRRM domain-containing protein n=1 Tax=Cerrena zonata TaxID=2478898 RepID=A0AAW0F726_9APHY
MIPFIPRSITKKPSKPLNVGARGNSHVPKLPVVSSKEKGNTKETSVSLVVEQEWTTLMYLAMSEYALWSDVELRHKIGTSDEGYIPLAYLLRHSSYFSTLENTTAEVLLVKSIRTHAPSVFDVRMQTSQSSRHTQHKQTAFGGFEIRRKDWQNVLKRSNEQTKQGWEGITVYMECLPLQHRSASRIVQFIQEIIGDKHPSSSSTLPEPFVQHVSFPKHFQDKHTDIPKCKGFALVTLSSSEQAQSLLENWPWKRRIDAIHSDRSPLAHEAHKFGFRTLSRVRWAALNEAYLSHGQSLLGQIPESEHHEDSSSERLVDDSPCTIDINLPTDSESRPSVSGKTTSSSLYPYNCLVFVRNIHPETNKTTLRTLFSSAFASPQTVLPPRDGLDYVDFNKGMDTCFLRLATSSHGRALINYFSGTHIIQASGVDDIGQPSNGDQKPISMELIFGTREELYWGNVPDKIRKQAVKRVLDLENGTLERDVEKDEKKRMRKRRRAN